MNRTEQGSATLFVVVVMTASVALIALVVDGGATQRARNQAFGLASAAARAGAQQLDDDARARGQVEIHPDAAAQAAQRYLAAHNTSGDVSVSGAAVSVTVEQNVDYTFWPGSTSVTSTATVEAQREPTS